MQEIGNNRIIRWGEGSKSPFPLSFSGGYFTVSCYPYTNKRALMYSLTRINKGYQALLDGLSVREIKILKLHSDLGDRVQEISKMSQEQLIYELENEYDLEIDSYPSNDCWVGIERLENAVPSWFTPTHCGWYKSREGEEFEEWARNFLMQDVRINLWIRYLELKKNPKEELSVGMYL